MLRATGRRPVRTRARPKETFEAYGATRELGPGTLVYLPPKEPHAVRAVEPSSLLVTILRRTGEA